jgi:hypothetical protein
VLPDTLQVEHQLRVTHLAPAQKTFKVFLNDIFIKLSFRGICVLYYFAVLRIQIWDPEPFLIPGSGMGKKSRSGSGDEHPGSYFLELRYNFWIKNILIL